MKNKLTAILALLLAAVMLAGCTGSKQATTQSTEMALKRAEAKERPVLMPGKTPKPRKVQYVVWNCQRNSESYNYKGDSIRPTYNGYYELDDRAVEQAKTMMNTDDITEFIPLYSYEDVLSLNFVSDDEISKGRYGHIAYIILDWTKAYAEKSHGAKNVSAVYEKMPDAAIKYNPYSKTGYMMYDLDNGMRLFFMMKDMGGSEGEGQRSYLGVNVLGNPVIMAERTSFAEFDGVLKNGATITELAKVDPALNAHIDYMRKGFFYTYKSPVYHDENGNIYETSYKGLITSNEEMGRTVSSVLILTDGVLRLIWDYDGSDYVVKRYEFREDFIIETYGIEVSYKIDDRYYVG